MTTVALIGPDGVGKSTVCEHLIHDPGLRLKYIYMGINPEASNYRLPTSRLMDWIKQRLHIKTYQGGPRDPRRSVQRSKSRLKNILRDAKSSLLIVNLMVEEWYRQAITWYFEWRNYVVLFNRHFFVDYYGYDIAGSDKSRLWMRRVHGFMLEHLYPKPDLVIYLDAPADILFARKHEGTVELLEERRQAYLGMQALVPHFACIDATQPVEAVVAEVKRTITAFAQAST